MRLPELIDRFVGRRAELDALGERVAAGARVLTLLGPPGTGKTRLSLRLAAEQVERGAVKGAVFVELAAALTRADMVRAVADAIALPLPPGVDEQSAVSRIGDALAVYGRALLVLDNVEQLVGHAAACVSAWSARAPEQTIVVTSRELMRIAGEEVFEVPPLTVPEEDADLDAITGADAVQLLLTRAKGFAASGDVDLEHVAAIARRLEGIPLALELAASRLALMGAAELRSRLARGQGVLGRGRRDAPARQATLRGALEWSWALLTEEERRALSCVAHFRGSFSVDAAVAAVARAPGEEGAALEALEALRDKSLIARATREGTRLRLFESVREHALEVGDDTGAALRLARHLARSAARNLADLRGKQARSALAWLSAERESMLGAHDGIRELEGEESLAMRVDLLLALDAVLARLGPGGAHLDRLDAALAQPGLDEGRRTRALVARARVLRDRGEMAACVRDLEAARDLLRGAERGAVRVELGEAWLAQGRFDEAQAQLELALREAQGWNERRTEQRARAALGLLHHGRGQLELAQEHYHGALDLAVELGDAHAEAQARRDLGTLCLMRGQHHRARAHYEEALARSPGGDLRLEGVVRGNLAILDQEQGRLDEAHAHLKRALACLRAIGDRPFEAHLLGYLGAVHHERGQLDPARDAYSRALEVLAEVRDVRLEGIFLAARAAALAASGRVGQAWNDLELAGRRLAEVGDPALVAALAAHRAQVVLAEAIARADRAATEAATAGAREAIAAALLHAEQSDDVRFALRMLKRALPADQLEIAPGATWFRVPGRDAVDLASRPTIARVLDALAAARLGSPGVPVPFDALVAAGWPDERVMPLAAQNRLRVAITTLRNLGLRGVVIHRDGGHLLDPEVPTTRAPAGSTRAG